MCLQKILQEKYNLSGEDIAIFLSNMERVFFSKRDIIQNEGKPSYYLYFVEKGIVRSFISREGKDITIYIVAEGDIPLDSVMLTEVFATKLSIEAIEDAIVWRIHKKQLAILCRNFVTFANFCRQLLEVQMREIEVYWTEYYWMDKKEQYKLMLKRQPRLLQRISLKDITSYLHVTPQSLSRIRASVD
ncbi:Crp/Fnr family transcriptional regulator [Coprobacter sp.]